MKNIYLPLAAAFMLIGVTASGVNAKGKKVLFIDSYHEGYAWSDGITEGIKATIGPSGAELKIHRMDTKRNADDAFKKEAAKKAKAEIES